MKSKVVLDNKLLVSALQSATDAVLIKDLEGNILIGSKMVAQGFGLPVEQLPGLNVYEVLTQEQAEMLRSASDLIRTTGQTQSSEETWVVDGMSHVLLATRSPITDADGSVIAILTIYKDISPLKKAYNAVEASQRSMQETATRLKLLTAAVPAMIWQLNGDLECCFVNDHFAEVTGRDIDSALGFGWQDIVLPSQRGMVYEELKRALSQCEPTQFQHALATLAGDRIYMSYVRPLLGADGKIAGLAGHSVDITDQYKTQESLELAKQELEFRVQERTQALLDSNDSLRKEISQRQLAQELLREKQIQLDQVSRISMLGRISGELAHELNQPLNAIQNYASALEQLIQELESPAILAIASRLQSEVQRAAGIVRRTRDFISAGRREHVPLLLEKPLTEVTSLLYQEATRRGMRIELDFQATDCHCVGDPVGLQQAFANLILNGLDAMAEARGCDQTISITLKRIDKWLSVSVADSGDGVSEPGRLFDSFYTTKADGLGMGLAISTAIAREHSGSLAYHPRTPKGSIFEFRIPAVSPPTSNVDRKET
jgi:PAS domain S-box-containing protein